VGNKYVAKEEFRGWNHDDENLLHRLLQATYEANGNSTVEIWSKTYRQYTYELEQNGQNKTQWIAITL
jgi:hypothetical protein